MNKIKILTWSVFLLILFNITTIATIYFHSLNENEEAIVTITSTENSGCELNGRYFKQNLGFDKEQMDTFREANRDFQPVANSIVYQLDSIKSEIFSELKKENSDTLRLNQLAKETGLLHTQLKIATNKFYIKIKSVCNKNQINQLQNVFSPLFMNNCKEAGKNCCNKKTHQSYNQ